jgi:nicotinamide riboside kinase
LDQKVLKTTLAIQLPITIKQLGFLNLRDYLQEKWDKSQLICDVDDMLPIAYGQTKFENYSQSSLTSICFATQIIVNKVFSVYYNYCDPLLDKAAQEHEYDLFFLTDIDVLGKNDLRDRRKDEMLCLGF